MRLPGPHEEFCLFDDARPRGAAARLYRDPVEVIAARWSSTWRTIATPLS